MNITKAFLNTIFVDYQEDMAVQIYDEKFAPNPVGYYVLLAEVDAALEKPNNAGRWTILDRIPYMENAVTFDPNSYAAQQKFFATDNREFSTLANALDYNRQRVAAIDPLALSKIQSVTQEGGIWIHGPQPSSNEARAQDFANAMENAWFVFHDPVTGEAGRLQGKDAVMARALDARTRHCIHTNIFPVYQQMLDLVDGFTADIVVANYPY